MAAVSNLKNMALCLFATCFVCSGVLGGVYAVTKAPIEETNAAILKASVAKVLPEGEISASKPIEVGGMPSEYYECVKDGNVVAYAVKSTVTGFGGALTLMVGVVPGGEIYNTSVLSHSETPGLGAKCTSDEKFYGQFRNLKIFDAENAISSKALTVRKDGGNLDAITASTITSRAYALAVRNAAEAIAALPMPISELSEDITMTKLQLITKGLIKDNPTFVLLLGMCPTLATTTSAIDGLSMGLATLFVLVLSNMVISAIAPVVPDKVHIPVYIVVIATFVTVLQLVMQAYVPGVYASLGLFIPLIVVNCIVLGRAEAFASKNGVIDSALDGIGVGLGFTLSLTVIGLVREILGSGSAFGFHFLPGDGILAFVMAPGAFLVLGYLMVLFNKIAKKD